MIRVFLSAAFGLCLCLAGVGCSAPEDPSAPMLSGEEAPKPMPSSTDVCADHHAGCPCDEPQQTVDCGRVKRVVNGYVWCSNGTQTCSEDGVWGECVGDQVAAAQ